MNLEKDFKLALYESYGIEFQNLFYRLMKEFYSDNFIAIKANGKFGDNGCDGYVRDKGIYFQVYGPEDLTKKYTQNNAKNKLVVDFKKIHILVNEHKSFHKIKEYIYVFNNRLDGVVNVDFSEKIEELRSLYKDIKYKIWDTQKLMSIFQILDIASKMRVLNMYADNLDGTNFIKNILVKNIQEDINHYNELKKWIIKIKSYISHTDFMSAFDSDIIYEMEAVQTCFVDLRFNDKKLHKFFLLLHRDIYRLTDYISDVTSPLITNPDIGKIPLLLMRSFEEVKTFDEISKKMLLLRKNLYNSIHKFLDYEQTLLDNYMDAISIKNKHK